MKKNLKIFVVLLLALVMGLGLTACKKDKDDKQDNQDQQNGEQGGQDQQDGEQGEETITFKVTVAEDSAEYIVFLDEFVAGTELTEETSVQFKVENLPEGKGLVSVKAGETALTPSEEAVYTLQAKADVEISVELADLHKVLKGHLYMKSKDEGGRELPVEIGYKPFLRLGKQGENGSLGLPEGVERAFPGYTTENVTFTLEVGFIVKVGDVVEVVDGGNVVGTLTVTEVS